METGQCKKQPKKPCTEIKIKTSESKEVRPMKEGGRVKMKESKRLIDWRSQKE